MICFPLRTSFKVQLHSVLLVGSSFEWRETQDLTFQTWAFCDLPSRSEWKLFRCDLQRKPSFFLSRPRDGPLTENFHRPPTSLLLSKQMGSIPSSRQHLIAAKPLTPAPTMATLLPMVDGMKKSLQKKNVLWCLGLFSWNFWPRLMCQDPHLNTRRHRSTLKCVLIAYKKTRSLPSTVYSILSEITKSVTAKSPNQCSEFQMKLQ